MPQIFGQVRLLLIVFSGGVLFLMMALCLVGVLVWQPAVKSADSRATPTPPNQLPASTTVSDTPASKTTDKDVQPSPTPAATVARLRSTATPIKAAGDKLTLPTATPTPTPPAPTLTPTATPTDTPLPEPPAPTPQPVEGLGVGQIAPDFTLGSNRAGRVSLSELRGKIVILNFWASWCPPCRHEVPALQAIHHEFGPQGVVVLAVNEGEKLQTVERFAHDNGVSFTVWLDEDKWAGNIYLIRSIPTTYFIDREGIIRAVQIGTMNREQIINHLEKLL